MLYLDNAAAMAPLPELVDFFAARCRDAFANQEAGHQLAYQLRQKLIQAARQVSSGITGVPDYPVIWGNSASELFALLGHSPYVVKQRCYFSPFEHPALQAALRHGEVVKSPAEAQLIAGTAVQSELGKIRSNSELFAAAAPGAICLLDAVQAAGKLTVDTAHADIIVISGVKFGAPGGAAMLLRPDWKLAGQVVEYFHLARSRDYLAGRPAPAVLLTLAEAVRLRQLRQREDWQRIADLNRRARASLAALKLSPTLPPEESSPYILHVMLPGKQAAVVVRQLAEYGVMCASGSACAAESRQPSPALLGLGFSRQKAYSGLRLSFGFDFQWADWTFFLEQFEKALKNY